jgi:hypothetical protein
MIGLDCVFERGAMIDSNNESLISLAQTAKCLPERRGGKRPHISCIYRWTTSGCKGVVLESIQVGGTRCTSKEALARFFQRLTQGDRPEVPEVRSVARRQRDTAHAIKELEAMGV